MLIYSTYSDIASDKTLFAFDASFDSRNGLTISDSIKNESITVGGFPMVYMHSATALVSFELDNTGMLAQTDWTFVVLFKKKAGVDSHWKIFRGAFGGDSGGGIALNTATGIMVCNNSPVLSTYMPYGSMTEWQAIGWMRNNSNGEVTRIWNHALVSSSKASFNTGARPDIRPTDTYDNFYCRGMFAFNKQLSDAELDDLRLNGIFPENCEVIINPWLEVDEPHFYDQWDGVARYKGYASSDAKGFKHLAGSCHRPDTPWVDRDDLGSGSIMLRNGYTRQGYNTIPYLATKVKGNHSHADDIEYPSIGCIHNMAESRLNFSGVADVTIKAIFDKSNRTYWKSSIESTSHYVDAGGGYYGLWHPTELLTDFIDLHAQAGHNGHILASITSDSGCVTGITAIQICKNGLTE